MIKFNLLKQLKFSNKRFRIYILSVLIFIILIPFFAFAVDNVRDGFRQWKNNGITDTRAVFWNATTTPGAFATSTTGICVYNSTNNDYFIPTRTWDEWKSFFDHKPAGLTLMQCKGDKACTLNGSGGYGGGETCASAPEDCGACAVTCPPGITDGRDYPDGNDSPYLAIVQVGSQCWLADNLKWIGSTDYGDGMIGVQRPTVNSSAYPRFYVNGYDTGVDEAAAAATSNYGSYGVLYNRPAALVACPTGTHLPSADEFSELAFNLGGTSDGGATGSGPNLKQSTGCTYPFGRCFAAPYGGSRSSESGGIFLPSGIYGTFWSTSTARSISSADNNFSVVSNTDVSNAYSVRCIMNNYKIKYLAGPNGSITGEYSQTVPYLEDSTAVTAVPDTGGYIFVNWSDGRIDNPRHDEGVNADITVTANFIKCGSGTFVGSDGVTYGTVLADDGKCWLDRNLGASRVATNPSDSLSYGDLYQWGRSRDGHQLRNSSATTTRSITTSPGHNQYIAYVASPYNWTQSTVDTLWDSGSVNDPCPFVFRVPTEAEMYNLFDTEGIYSEMNIPFTSSLKLPNAGWREAELGVRYEGTYGGYWTSSHEDIFGRSQQFGSSAPSLPGATSKTRGLSVRCIKDGSYNFTYTAGANGWLQGNANQTVGSYMSGTAVTAVANANYKFIKWDDERTDNPRTDNSISGNNVSVTAIFAPAFTITYVVNANSAGGSAYLSGQSSQYIAVNTNGSWVVAIYDDSYQFLGWSETPGGSIVAADEAHQPTNVTANKTYYANFSLCPSSVYDNRDGETYSVKDINGLCWTIRNMAYIPSIDYTSFHGLWTPYYYIYGYSPTWLGGGPDLNEAKANGFYGYFGVLYNATAAEGACPNGWRLPTKNESDAMYNSVGSDSANLRSENLGASETYWTGSGGSGPGSNETFFTAYPAGTYSNDHSFNNVGERAGFWTSTPYGSDGNNYAAHLYNGTIGGTFTYIESRDLGYSVRCVK